MLRALEVGRFCRILGTLRLNGLTMIEAMPIAGGTVRNMAVASAVDHAQGPLSRGEGLSAPLAALDVFPPMAVEMIAVGEESGKLDEMLLEAAEMLDEDADRKIQSVLALLVPAVTVVLGIIVASVIGAILSAILGTYRLAI
jgi:general secretion pathway protein F